MTAISAIHPKELMCFDIPFTSSRRASATALLPGFNPLYTNDHYSGHDTLFRVLTESQNLNFAHTTRLILGKYTSLDLLV